MIFSSIQKKNELKRFYPKSYNEIDTLAAINGTVAFMRQSYFFMGFFAYARRERAVFVEYNK